MPNLNAREVSRTVREYFDEIKKSKFLFDVVFVEYDTDEGHWDISCDLANVFDEEPRRYIITVGDESGEILSVRRGE